MSYLSGLAAAAPRRDSGAIAAAAIAAIAIAAAR